MFKKRSAKFFVVGLCLLCAGSAGAASRASVALATFCPPATGTIAQEEAAIDRIAIFAIPAVPGTVQQYENDFIEYDLPGGGTRGYHLQTSTESTPGILQSMRDVIRMAYMTGAPVGYCYVAGPGGWRKIKAIAILGDE